MSRHATFDDLGDTSRYTDLYHDGLVALWRERYEDALHKGTPAPNLPREVEAAAIRGARRMRSKIIAEGLSAGLRRVAAAVRLTWQGTVRAVRRQAALRQLQRLDARMLKDIGLAPGDVWSMADAHARGVPVGGRHPRRRHPPSCLGPGCTG